MPKSNIYVNSIEPSWKVNDYIANMNLNDVLAGLGFYTEVTDYRKYIVILKTKPERLSTYIYQFVFPDKACSDEYFNSSASKFLGQYTILFEGGDFG